MKSGLLLNVVVEEGSAILQHLLHKNEFLLVGRDPLFILNLGINVFDAVQRHRIKSDGLARERLDENLHGQCIERIQQLEVQHETRTDSRYAPNGKDLSLATPSG